MVRQSPIKWNYLAIIIGVLLLGAIQLPYILRLEMMSPVFYTPFYSGAENNPLFSTTWYYASEESEVLTTKSYIEQLQFKFTTYDDQKGLKDYTGFNNRAYVTYIQVASSLFPFTGPMGAVVISHLLIHILICVYIARFIYSRRFSVLFLLLYGINPIILWVLLTPYYYFLQAIPSFLLIMLLHRSQGKWHSTSVTWLTGVISFLIRPTTLAINSYNVYISLKRYKSITRFLAAGLFIIFIVALNRSLGEATLQQPWHTAVAGLGAFPTKAFDAYPGDHFSYSVYNQIHNDTIDGSFESRIYEPNFRVAYYTCLKDYYMQICADYPHILARNAILNTLQSYSIGHWIDHLWINILSAALGLTVIIYLVAHKNYTGLIAIGLSSITFTLIHPPIITYMFGSYLIIKYTLLSTAEKRWVK